MKAVLIKAFVHCGVVIVVVVVVVNICTSMYMLS